MDWTDHRYANGAATNPDAHVVAYAAAQVKKGLDVAKKLGALNFVFWGGREGYNSLLNTNINHELNSLAKFYRMALSTHCYLTTIRFLLSFTQSMSYYVVITSQSQVLIVINVSDFKRSKPRTMKYYSRALLPNRSLVTREGDS